METVVAEASRGDRGGADYDVIEQIDLHHLGGIPQAAGHLEVGRTGRRVAAGVIVDGDQGGDYFVGHDDYEDSDEDDR